MLINDQLKAIKHRLEDQITVPRLSVEIAPGRFDLAELMREGFRAPAIRIAFIGAAKSDPEANEEREFGGAFSAFIITEGDRRGEDGRSIMQATADALILWHSGIRGTGIPADIRLDALYTMEIERRGVALHAVSWTQRLRIGNDEIGAGVHDRAAVPAAETEALLTIEDTDVA